MSDLLKHINSKKLSRYNFDEPKKKSRTKTLQSLAKKNLFLKFWKLTDEECESTIQIELFKKSIISQYNNEYYKIKINIENNIYLDRDKKRIFQKLFFPPENDTDYEYNYDLCKKYKIVSKLIDMYYNKNNYDFNSKKYLMNIFEDNIINIDRNCSNYDIIEYIHSYNFIRKYLIERNLFYNFKFDVINLSYEKLKIIEDFIKNNLNKNFVFLIKFAKNNISYDKQYHSIISNLKYNELEIITNDNNISNFYNLLEKKKSYPNININLIVQINNDHYYSFDYNDFNRIIPLYGINQYILYEIYINNQIGQIKKIILWIEKFKFLNINSIIICLQKNISKNTIIELNKLITSDLVSLCIDKFFEENGIDLVKIIQKLKKIYSNFELKLIIKDLTEKQLDYLSYILSRIDKINKYDAIDFVINKEISQYTKEQFTKYVVISIRKSKFESNYEY